MTDPIPVLEIGGTHVTAALVDPATWTQAGSVQRWDVDSHGSAEELLDAFVAAAAGLGAGAGTLGVAIPDPFDYATGVAKFRGVGKFESLYDVDVRAAILAGNAELRDVVFVNDADAFGLGEWVNGAATGWHRCVGITLGTGIGSTFLDDGRIVDSGPDVAPGGRAHRLRVQGKPLEDLVSRRAIRRAYKAVTGDADADVLDIAIRARAGDPVATKVLATAMRILGETLRPVLDRFAPDVIVVGGSMAGSWDLFESSFREGLNRDGQPILLAEHREDAPLVGAAWWATEGHQALIQSRGSVSRSQ